MTPASIPLIVLSSQQDDAEFINKILRGAGHAAQCHWLNSLDQLSETIQIADAQLLWLFCDHFNHDIKTVIDVRNNIHSSLPLIAVRNQIDEALCAAAMNEGAADLISTAYADRVRIIAERELHTYRLERALNTTIHSARQYQEQLQTFMQGSDDAIAHVTEGILIDTNPTWDDVLRRKPDEMIGPLMDLFDPSSHAALKGALVASQRGQWTNEPLKVNAICGDGEKIAIELALEAALFDSEPAVKLSILRDAELEQPEEIVTRAMSTDPATGFFHRRGLIDAITKRLAEPGSTGTRALACIRPDKFGAIADEIGPVASEEIIIQLAEVIRTSTHNCDIYGRFGGTVFVVWIERGTLRDIEAWAETLIKSISGNMFLSENKSLSMTCTVGLADIGPDNQDLTNLFCGAQRANQRGRQRGGNEVVLEETANQSTRMQRFDEIWVQQIKSALVENRFQLARLSVASLHGEPKSIYDSVIKMIDMQGEEVPASTFLPVAERNNLLRAIDRWVVDAGTRFAADNPNDTLFIKLSGESIIDPDFLPWIGKCVQAVQLNPKQLCFQISEEAVTQHLQQSIEVSRRLRSNGFGFAIEHFGIGRDPIRLLKQISMDYIKLDGSLMQGLGSSQPHQDAVRDLIKEATNLGISSIAERVEDANTMAVLFQLGIGYVQGHYVHEQEVILEEVV